MSKKLYILKSTIFLKPPQNFSPHQDTPHPPSNPHKTSQTIFSRFKRLSQHHPYNYTFCPRKSNQRPKIGQIFNSTPHYTPTHSRHTCKNTPKTTKHPRNPLKFSPTPPSNFKSWQHYTQETLPVSKTASRQNPKFSPTQFSNFDFPSRPPTGTQAHPRTHTRTHERPTKAGQRPSTGQGRTGRRGLDPAAAVGDGQAERRGLKMGVERKKRKVSKP